VLVILTAQAVYAFNARCIAVCARPTGGFASRTVVARSTLGAARRSHRAIARRDLDEGAVLTLHDLVPANRIADVVTVGGRLSVLVGQRSHRLNHLDSRTQLGSQIVLQLALK